MRKIAGSLTRAGWVGVPFMMCVLVCAQTGTPAKLAADNNAPEINSHDLPATFTSKVNLVVVRVVVRDRKANAIGTLKREDFQLFDKGKAQVISKFAVEKTTRSAVVRDTPAAIEGAEKPETAPPIADRFIAYLFDDIHLDFGDLAQAREAAKSQLAESLDPGGRVAIYTTSGQTMLEFTDDAAKLRAALDRIQPRPRRAAAGTSCPDIPFYMADLIQNKNDGQALAAATMDAMACASIPPQQRAMAEQMARSAASQAFNVGQSETRLALGVLRGRGAAHVGHAGTTDDRAGVSGILYYGGAHGGERADGSRAARQRDY